VIASLDVAVRSTPLASLYVADAWFPILVPAGGNAPCVFQLINAAIVRNVVAAFPNDRKNRRFKCSFTEPKRPVVQYLICMVYLFVFVFPSAIFQTTLVALKWQKPGMSIFLLLNFIFLPPLHALRL
jgi:hypothetical protein